jgi:hypothetical protein
MLTLNPIFLILSFSDNIYGLFHLTRVHSAHFSKIQRISLVYRKNNILLDPWGFSTLILPPPRETVSQCLLVIASDRMERGNLILFNAL